MSRGRAVAKPSAEPLTVESIGKLNNGFAEAIINAALKAAIRDTEDRGGDGKARKTTIVVSMLKLDDAMVKVEVEAKTTMPAYKTDATIAQIHYESNDGPGLKFQPMAPDNPEQTTIPYPAAEAGG